MEEQDLVRFKKELWTMRAEERERVEGDERAPRRREFRRERRDLDPDRDVALVGPWRIDGPGRGAPEWLRPDFVEP